MRIFVFLKQFINFLSKHINKTEFFLRIIEGYFFYGEIKCKQGVKNFAKHPNKMEIFLCIVEGLFFIGEFFSNLVLLTLLFKKVSLE